MGCSVRDLDQSDGTHEYPIRPVSDLLCHVCVTSVSRPRSVAVSRRPGSGRRETTMEPPPTERDPDVRQTRRHVVDAGVPRQAPAIWWLTTKPAPTAVPNPPHRCPTMNRSLSGGEHETATVSSEIVHDASAFRLQRAASSQAPKGGAPPDPGIGCQREHPRAGDFGPYRKLDCGCSVARRRSLSLENDRPLLGERRRSSVQSRLGRTGWVLVVIATVMGGGALAIGVAASDESHGGAQALSALAGIVLVACLAVWALGLLVVLVFGLRRRPSDGAADTRIHKVHGPPLD